MKIARLFMILTAVSVIAGCQTQTRPATEECKECSSLPTPTKLGVDELFAKHMDLIRGKRVGLITNPTGLDGKLTSDIELFRSHPDVKLVALYGPEHGVRGNAQAGEYVAFYYDEQLKLPVFSLYGPSHKPPTDMMTNIDEYMRKFDTQHMDKQVEPGMMKSVDVMVFDMQDAGTRVYTYIATMAYAMAACADAKIPFIVLDRPNPINGVLMEGPILEYPKHSSFIGLYPIPLRHGMTMGEMARLFNGQFLTNKADLTVVPMENWKRDEWFDETSLPWVLPSPNLPTVETATVYPGQVLLEGTSLSEGRGTTKPFEYFGAPWIDGFALAEKLNALNLPGVKFREVYFTPTFSKFSGKQCGGCQVHVTDRNTFRPIATVLAELAVIKEMYGKKLEIHGDYFDKVMGTSSVREALERGEPAAQISAGFKAGIEEFSKLREPYLLYH